MVLTLLAGYGIFRGLEAVAKAWSESNQSISTPIAPAQRANRPNAPVLPTIRGRVPTAVIYENAQKLFESEYVSYTRLNTFNQCQRKFFLTYLRGFRQQERDKTVATNHGSDFHQRSEDLFNENIGKTIGSLLSAPAVNRDSRLRQILQAESPDSVVLATELELRFKADGREFLGYVDLAVERPDGMVTLIDAKTGNRQYQLYPPDPLQLDIYSFPELLLRPERKVHLAYVLVDVGKVIRWSNGPENRNDVFARIQRSIERVEAESEFEPNFGPLCKYCHVESVCKGEGESVYKTFAKNSPK